MAQQVSHRSEELCTFHQSLAKKSHSSLLPSLKSLSRHFLCSYTIFAIVKSSCVTFQSVLLMKAFQAVTCKLFPSNMDTYCVYMCVHRIHLHHIPVLHTRLKRYTKHYKQ